MPPVTVTRSYLEMTSPAQLRPARSPDPSLRLAEAKPCPPELYRFLYKAVGERYHWFDRRNWTDRQIRAHLRLQTTSIWVLHSGKETAGWFELARHPDDSIEIVYFGLMHEYMGRGLGKHMLTLAVAQAWGLGARRVWLHTCTLDHAAALPNYQSRGFVQFKTEEYIVNE